jgi:hypothetical protein
MLNRACSPIFYILFFLLIFFSYASKAQQIAENQFDSSRLSSRVLENKAAKDTSFFDKIFKSQGSALYLFGSMSLSKQSLFEKGVTTPFNYLYNEVNNNVYKTGFSFGVRLEDNLKRNNRYSVSVAMNQINAGAYYQRNFTLSPFIEEFTHFKADNKFTTFNIAAHFKYFIPLRSIKKHKFYAIAGPSFDYRISKISQESLVNGATKRAFIGADFGAEFERDKRYLFFAHYKLGANLSQTAVPVTLYRFEFGMCINTKHLFNSK